MTREQFIIGVDLGGTNVVVGAMPIDGSREIGMRTLPTRADLGADGVTDRIAAMIENVIIDVRRETGAEREDILGICEAALGSGEGSLSLAAGAQCGK